MCSRRGDFLFFANVFNVFCIILDMGLNGKRFRERGAKFRKGIEKIRSLRIRFLNLYLLAIALILTAVFLSFELFLRIHDLYKPMYWVDIPSHFFAGMAIASLTIWLLHFTKGKYRNSFVMISTLIVALFWEVLETIGEVFIPDPPYLQDFFFWDGFWDVAVTVIGGYAFIWLFDHYIKIKLRKYIHKDITTS